MTTSTYLQKLRRLGFNPFMHNVAKMAKHTLKFLRCENTPSNNIQALTESISMCIWVIGTLRIH